MEEESHPHSTGIFAGFISSSFFVTLSGTMVVPDKFEEPGVRTGFSGPAFSVTVTEPSAFKVTLSV